MKIITTADGSNSIIHDVFGQSYHSDRGAIGEAMHVFIESGFDYLAHEIPTDMTVLEFGFGSGLNAWLTLERAVNHGLKVVYHAIELYPVSMDVVDKLNYTSDLLFRKLHDVEWNRSVVISDTFELVKHKCNFVEFDFKKHINSIDLVYYDAFAPESQPELWSEDVFRQVYSVMKPGGILTTYSSKGIVKESLRNSGFQIKRLPGALGKRHMLRAIKY